MLKKIEDFNMADFNKITKKQFDKVNDKHQPSGWIKFAFKHFSKETEKKNMTLKNSLIFLLIGLFAVGFFCTVFNAPRKIIAIVTLTYSILLIVFGLYLFSAVILNNIRINKIITELDITKDEYNYLVKKYYEI